MQEGFININNIPTKVLCFGRWLTDKPSDEENKVILLIPGNPGIVDFYIKFMQILYDYHKCPVWIIGHTGHQRSKSKENLQKPLGLRQQVDQKIAFIQQYIGSDTKLFIISHSIGSYMTLQLFKEPTIEHKIRHAYFLFPTIENMIETPNGKPMQYFKPLVPILCFFAWILSSFPKVFVLKLIQIYISIANIPNEFIEMVYQIIDPKVIRRVFFLGFEELEQVRQRDDDILRKNYHKISFLYGVNDGWCREEFCDKIKNDFVDMRVTKEPLQHAFIFRENQEVADIITNWMKETDVE